MRAVEQIKNPVQDLIASYQMRVDAITAIIDKTSHILFDSKEKEPILNHELNESMGRSSTNKMMSGILLDQEQKEKGVKQSLKNFLKIQKEKARELREASTRGDLERMKKAQTEIEKGIIEIKNLLKDFYGQQKEPTKELRRLISKGKDSKETDFKDMMNNLQNLTIGKNVKAIETSFIVTDNKSQNLPSFCNGGIVSLSERAISIEEFLKEIRRKIKAFQKEHSEIRAGLNEKLKNFEENLHNEVNQFVNS